MNLEPLRRGINMDHEFFPYRRSTAPLTADEWAHVEGSLKPEEFAAAARCGFGHVRLCLGRDMLQSREAPYGFHDRGFAAVDRAVSMIRAEGLGVILDLHELPAPEFGKKPELQYPFVEFWREAASRWHGYPDDVYYGLLNEPITADADLWRGIVRRAIGVIRLSDPERPVIVAGDGWGGLDSLVALGELDLLNVVYDFHFYLPMAYTHQGAGWGSPELKAIRGIPWPMEPVAYGKARDEFRATGLGDWAFREYEKMPDREGLRKRMSPVVEWGKRTKLPLYCGEFGVRREGSPVEVRARWTRDVRELLEEAGIPWALWSYHSGFDLFDRGNNPDKVLLEALGMKEETR